MRSQMRQFTIFSFQSGISETRKTCLVSLRRPSVASDAGGFLCNLNADAGANARGAGFDHGARVRHALNAAGSFDPEFRTDYAAHQSDIRNRGAAFRESGRGLDEISAGFPGSLARANFLVVGQ